MDFLDSHFKNVKFIGAVKNCIFRGVSLHSEGTTDDQPESRKINPMEIDFSKAKLSLVSFQNQCGWENLKLPKDGNHILIKDMKNAIDYLKEIHDNTINEKKFIDAFISIYGPGSFCNIMRDGEIDIINVNDLTKIYQKYSGSEQDEAEIYCKKFIKEIIKET